MFPASFCLKDARRKNARFAWILVLAAAWLAWSPLEFAIAAPLEASVANKVHVALSADRSEWVGAFALINSIAKHMSQPERLAVHFIVEEHDAPLLESTVRCIGRNGFNWSSQVASVAIPGPVVEKLRPAVLANQERLSSLHNFVRLRLDQILPRWIEKVVFLDVDVIVKHDIAILFDSVLLNQNQNQNQSQASNQESEGIAASANAVANSGDSLPNSGKAPRHYVSTRRRYRSKAPLPPLRPPVVAFGHSKLPDLASQLCANVNCSHPAIAGALQSIPFDPNAQDERVFVAGVFVARLDRWRTQNCSAKLAEWTQLRQRDNTLWSWGTQPPMLLTFLGQRAVEYFARQWHLAHLGHREVTQGDINWNHILHWNGPRKPWLSEGNYPNIWKPYQVQPTGACYTSAVISHRHAFRSGQFQQTINAASANAVAVLNSSNAIAPWLTGGGGSGDGATNFPAPPGAQTDSKSSFALTNPPSSPPSSNRIFPDSSELPVFHFNDELFSSQYLRPRIDVAPSCEELNGIYGIGKARPLSSQSKGSPRIFLITVVGSDQNIVYLNDFLDHYQTLGIHSSNFIIIIHLRSVFTDFSAVAAALDERQITYETWVDVFTPPAKNLVMLALLQHIVSADDWVVFADADELQEYPLPLGQFFAMCDRYGYNAVHGIFVDRLAQSGALPDVQSDASLWEQFPLGCSISDGVAEVACVSKIFALRGYLRTGGLGGNHFVAALDGCPPGSRQRNWLCCWEGRHFVDPLYRPWMPYNFSNECPYPRAVFYPYRLAVHHFKWVRGVIEGMSRRADDFVAKNQNQFSVVQDFVRVVAHYRNNDNRMCVECDSAMCAVPFGLTQDRSSLPQLAPRNFSHIVRPGLNAKSNNNDSRSGLGAGRLDRFHHAATAPITTTTRTLANPSFGGADSDLNASNADASSKPGMDSIIALSMDAGARLPGSIPKLPFGRPVGITLFGTGGRVLGPSEIALYWLATALHKRDRERRMSENAAVSGDVGAGSGLGAAHALDTDDAGNDAGPDGEGAVNAVNAAADVIRSSNFAAAASVIPVIWKVRVALPKSDCLLARRLRRQGIHVVATGRTPPVRRNASTANPNDGEDADYKVWKYHVLRLMAESDVAVVSGARGFQLVDATVGSFVSDRLVWIVRELWEPPKPIQRVDNKYAASPGVLEAARWQSGARVVFASHRIRMRWSSYDNGHFRTLYEPLDTRAASVLRKRLDDGNGSARTNVANLHSLFGGNPERMLLLTCTGPHDPSASTNLYVVIAAAVKNAAHQLHIADIADRIGLVFLSREHDGALSRKEEALSRQLRPFKSYRFEAVVARNLSSAALHYIASDIHISLADESLAYPRDILEAWTFSLPTITAFPVDLNSSAAARPHSASAFPIETADDASLVAPLLASDVHGEAVTDAIVTMATDDHLRLRLVRRAGEVSREWLGAQSLDPRWDRVLLSVVEESRLRIRVPLNDVDGSPADFWDGIRNSTMASNASLAAMEAGGSASAQSELGGLGGLWHHHPVGSGLGGGGDRPGISGFALSNPMVCVVLLGHAAAPSHCHAATLYALNRQRYRSWRSLIADRHGNASRSDFDAAKLLASFSDERFSPIILRNDSLTAWDLARTHCHPMSDLVAVFQAGSAPPSAFLQRWIESLDQSSSTVRRGESLSMGVPTCWNRSHSGSTDAKLASLCELCRVAPVRSPQVSENDLAALASKFRYSPWLSLRSD